MFIHPILFDSKRTQTERAEPEPRGGDGYGENQERRSREEGSGSGLPVEKVGKAGLKVGREKASPVVFGGFDPNKPPGLSGRLFCLSITRTRGKGTAGVVLGNPQDWFSVGGPGSMAEADPAWVHLVFLP